MEIRLSTLLSDWLSHKHARSRRFLSPDKKLWNTRLSSFQTLDLPQQKSLYSVRIWALNTPRSKERGRFLIHRQINIKELRHPPLPAEQNPEPAEFTGTVTRSKSDSAQVNQAETQHGKVVAKEHETADFPATKAFPIHIQYALHYLPVLAAMMLSRHIKKGDLIDLPLPHPELWYDVLSYIYTGKGEITLGMRENILYLAGSVESSSIV